MSDVIFKSIKMQKKDFYGWLKTEITKVGWQNISSRPAADNDIFHSVGESGQDNLIVRMKEYYSSQTGTLFSDVGVYVSLMPLSSYTPGNAGVSGVAYPPLNTTTFVHGRFVSGSLAGNTLMTVYYHMNKDRVIFIIEWDRYVKEESMFCIFGKPTNTIAKTTDITKTLVACSSSYTNQISFATLADYYEYTSGAVGNYLTMDLPRAKNSKGDFMMSEIIITNTIDGIHSLVDGIYSINSDSSLTYNFALLGDELIDEDMKKYRITPLIGRTNGITIFPHPFIAFQVE